MWKAAVQQRRYQTCFLALGNVAKYKLIQ